MTKDELFKKLKPLADSLQNSLTSKQHAFNSHKNIVDDCKLNGINNKLIVEAINSHLPESAKMTLSYFKNLLNRAKTKTITASTKEKLTYHSKTDTELTSHQPENLADYLKVCFGAERLAIRAMNAGVSIETINSWNCPNQIRLGTILSNHIQNK